MGVRGLTSYIARNAEQYLMPYQLHDCNLVIDGDNLACNLYKDVTGTYSAFGGDYDDFHREVVNFFHVLAECKIQAFVLMDGGYEHRKLHTVAQRLRGKIAIIKRINPCGSVPVFPVLLKEAFVDAVRECGVPVMRCIFEADEELAALSRKLNCPVLSYDSDFYIHNVRYIPLITLTMKAHTGCYKTKDDAVDNTNERRLRKNEVKHMEKKTKANRVFDKIQIDNVDKKSKNNSQTYKYLDCCLYRIENLMRYRCLNKEKLPLFAALLGNDYIARSSFKKFFEHGMGKSGRSRKLKYQQKRISLILRWLRDQTVESAMEKVFSRLKKRQRESLAAQVAAATAGYSNELCVSYNVFKKNYANIFENISINDDAGDDDDELNETVEDDSDSDIEYTDEEIEEDELIEDVELIENDELEQSDDELDEEKTEKTEIVAENDGNEKADIDKVATNDEYDDNAQIPEWFLHKLYQAQLPRYCVDLLHLKKYINSPQIEHFPYNECNEKALPLLIYIFTLLNSVEGAETKERVAEDGTIIPIEFTYLTRATRVTNIRYHRYAKLEKPLKYSFQPTKPNPLLLNAIFEMKMPHINVDELFEAINLIPKDLQLYFLAIIYWLQKSQHCNLIHLNSLILCLVILRTNDTKIPVERDLKRFQKRFGKILKKERTIRDKEIAENITRTIKEELKALPIIERINFIQKSDCYLVQDRMLKHFHMQDIFKHKYDLYSTIVLHGFAEFQSILFHLNALNSLLDSPYENPKMGKLFCGVFLYNLYDLLHARADVNHYVEKFIFGDSMMMFEFYSYLLNWFDKFLPTWKKEQNIIISKNLLKKQNKKARKNVVKIVSIPNEDVLDNVNNEIDDSFYDINNKFSELVIR